MIDSLIRRDRNSPDFMTEKDILANIVTFYIAGTDTTATIVTWMTYILSTQPEVVAKLRSEIESVLLDGSGPRRLVSSDFRADRLDALRYCDAVIKETLRLYTPANLNSASLESEFESFQLSNGLRVEAGDDVW